MATSAPAKRIIQQVRPILSLDQDEARRRVFQLYKAWYRTIPYIGKLKKIKTIAKAAQRVWDIRIIVDDLRICI